MSWHSPKRILSVPGFSESIDSMYEILTHCYDFLAKGGVFMIPILLCSLGSVVIFVERCVTLRRARHDMEQRKTALLDAIRQHQYERAYTLCDGVSIPLIVIARKALDSRSLTREALAERMQDTASSEVARLERFFSMLGALASISPLLGLLGTVTGMIQVFGRVADEFNMGGQANAGMLAGGIWEALITTAAGLCVAIPAFIMHRYLVSRLDDFVLELEDASTSILDAIVPPPQRADAKMTAAAAAKREAKQDAKKRAETPAPHGESDDEA